MIQDERHIRRGDILAVTRNDGQYSCKWFTVKIGVIVFVIIPGGRYCCERHTDFLLD